MHNFLIKKGNGKESIRFDPLNKLPYHHDFRIWQGVPHNIDFYPVEIDHQGDIRFIGDGFGIIQPDNEFGLTGRYGSGAIYINIDVLPNPILDWCKEHMFIKPTTPISDIITTEVKVFLVEKRCEKPLCNGTMEQYLDDYTLVSYSELYLHRCTICKTEQRYNVTYPHTEHKKIN